MQFFKFFIISLISFFSFQASVFGKEIIISSKPINSFEGAKFGEKTDGLIWRGGLVLTSDVEEFGGLSGITFTGFNNQVAIVSDIGNFFSGEIIYDKKGAPLSFDNFSISAIKNSKGNNLPRKFAKDAEAIDLILRNGLPVAVRVGFENLTRVADFKLTNGAPMGAAKEVAIPDALSNERTNGSLEALCIAPKSSPVAGSTLLITERMRDGKNIAAFMLGNKDKGSFAIKKTLGMNPTDCAFLENGDLLILERGTSFLSFTMQLRLIDANDVQPNAILKGKSILNAAGSEIDNMEGLAVHKDASGNERITIISDDNFNKWEKTLLLQFSFE